MKKTYKILSVFITLAIMLNTVVFAAAFSDVSSESSYSEAVDVLSAFGIINGYEDGTFGPEKDVTRAEFSAMLMRAMASSGMGSSDPSGMPFTDLDGASWAISDIRTAYDLKIINGMTPTTFEPNNNVTYEQALKMIVCALNYGASAENIQQAVSSTQPWYYGYMQTAYSLKLTDGITVTPEKPAKRWEIARMIYNSLDVKLLEKAELTGGGEYYKETDNTFLNSKLDITKARGEVYADETSTISPDGSVARAGQALIFDPVTNKTVTYTKGAIDVSPFLGKTVDYYYKTDDFGVRTLVLILSKGGSDETLAIDISNIDSISGTYSSGYTISYYATSTATTLSQVKTASNPTVSINGVVKSDISGAELYNLLESGKVELISTGTAYTKINIESAETYVVKSVNTTDKYIVDMYRPSSSNTLTLDENDENVVLSINNSAGGKVSLSGLSQYNVLSVKKGMGASNRTTLDVTVSTKSTSGTIKEIDLTDNIISINGTSYKISKYLVDRANSTLKTFSVGDTCTFYLDKNDCIAYILKTANTSSYYGYMSTAGIDDNRVKINLISSKTTTMGSPTLTVAKKVKVDGETYTNADDVLEILEDGASSNLSNIDGSTARYSQLIKYSLNSSGEINSIETVIFGENEDPSDDTVFKGYSVNRPSNKKLTYKSQSYDFVNPNSTSDKFRINSSTQVFVVPLNRSDYDSYGRKSYGYFKNDRSYIVEAYDVTGSLKVAKAVVVYETEDTQSVIDYSTPVFIITAISSTTNADGNECDRVTGIEITTNGTVTEKTVYTESSGIIKDVYNIGDVIMYVLNNKGYITRGNNTLSRVFSPDEFASYTRHKNIDSGASNDCDLYGGLLMGSDPDGNKQQFDIAMTANVSDCESANTASFNAGSSVKYFTYEVTESGTKKISKQDGVLDLSAFPSYNDSIEADPENPQATKMFVYSTSDSVRMVYVIK